MPAPPKGELFVIFRFVRIKLPLSGELANECEPERVRSPQASSPSQSSPAGLASSPKGRALGIAVKFPAQVQSVWFRQSLSLWERWICEAKTERARTLSKKAHPRTARRAVRGCCVMIYDVFTMRKVFPRLMQSSSRSYSAGTSPMTFTFSSAGRSVRISWISPE